MRARAYRATLPSQKSISYSPNVRIASRISGRGATRLTSIRSLPSDTPKPAKPRERADSKCQNRLAVRLRIKNAKNST
jgi:hypothetical protein